MKLKFLQSIAVVGALTFINSKVARAEGEIDSIEGYDALNGVTETPNTSNGSSGSSIADTFRGYNPVTEAGMATGQYYATPFVNFFGSCVGFLLTLVVGWMTLQTAIDLLYWAIPPIRGLLGGNKQQQQQPMGMGMGGMGMGGMQQQSATSKLPIFVSDDMLQAMEDGSAQQQGSMGMGMGMGGMGGYGMGGMGMGGMQQQQSRPPHVLASYFKKRILSVIFLALCLTLLFSSVILDTGINLGGFVIKVINIINDVIVSNT